MTLKDIFEKCKFDSDNGDKIMIAIHHHDTKTLETFNYGFSALELLGFLSMRKDDVERQISGEVQPDVVKVKRTVIIDEEPEASHA